MPEGAPIDLSPISADNPAIAPAAVHERRADEGGVAGRWRAELYAALRGRADPAIVFPEATISAASLWVASRLWVDVLRQSGVVPGDRVVLRWHASPGFLAFFIAAVWEGLSVAVIPPGMTSDECMEKFDARLGLGCDGLSADGAGCPVFDGTWKVRDARMAPTPEARLFLRTCGTCGSPGWVALSDENIWSVLDSHRPELVKRDDVVLSVLPWFHSFGLIIDLLPALLGAGIIVREQSQGKDVDSILDAAAAYGVTWCSMVPLQTQRIAAVRDGVAFLRGLRGGVIGGASASRPLAETIAGTNLFVGYGQTEASPGITLGRPGEWVPGAIGTAVGCEVRVGGDGRLHVRGPNVCLGKWTERGLEKLPAGRWLDTGDIVSPMDGQLIFMGRSDHNFKLANGRMVDAALIETRLRASDEGIVDAAVISPDGFGVVVFVVMRDPEKEPRHESVAGVLGSLAERLERVIVLAGDGEFRTGKGALDRVKLMRAWMGRGVGEAIAA